MTAIKRNPVEPLHRVAGNLEPIGAYLVDQDEVAINLTGKTVVFRMIRFSDGTVIINDVAGTVLVAATGKVQYQPTGTQMDISSASLDSESFAMYWKILETGQPTIRLPYDGSRWMLILHVETDS